ncbi:hypothetical protein P7C71_g257, partial [Lecanoromycetidae sp. Uapishka_2]
MESDIREAIEAAAGNGRAMNGEKSPAGSVKRARQRAAAGLPPEHTMPAYPTPLSIRTPGQSPQDKKSPQQGSSPSDGAQNPQYPSQGNRQGPSPQKNVPPQRPPRPNFVPPMAPNLDMQENKPPPLQFRRPSNPDPTPRNYWEDSYTDSSSSSRPLTTASNSTTGSIPDFPSTPSIPVPPVPTFQPPPRRNLGPPPSARKGGSSYYSQTSFVPPIPEEMSDAHSSYASSHVIPESWGDGPPEYYMGPGIEEEEEDMSPGGNSGRASSAGDHDDASGLVRKGSQGRPRKTSLETLESGDESDIGDRRMRELNWQARQDERWRPGGSGGAGTDPIGRHNFRNQGRLNNPYSGYESDATFLDSPRSSMPPLMPPSNQYFGTPDTNASPIDPRVGEILGHLEKGGALASSGTASPEPASDKGFKRPARLNLEESKEPRGSATSLPELIRRATKLASNLDRGKTASRIGMLDLLNRKEEEKEKERALKGSSGSISDILAAFPSPSPTTPTHHKPNGWPSPSPHGKSALSRSQTVRYGSQSSSKPRERRCCGLPLWAFVLLLIIVLLLIAAAVIIPVTLIVLPKQHKNNGPSLSECQTSHACAHDGTAVVINQQCRCICSNGFTGSTCNTPADSGCTTTDIPVTNTDSSYHNATLGSDIPRILNAAQTNFSIPITSYTVLSLFSATNLSCSSENALVTINNKAQRRSFLAQPPNHDHLPNGATPLSLENILLPPTRTHAHSTRPLHARGAAQSSNGIIFAAPSVDGSSGGSSAAAAAATTAPATSGNSRPVTQQVLDFGRTAVLFIFQETSDLDTATKALGILSTTLSGKTFDASQTSAGGNITVDLSALTVGFGNGTLYGGKGAS